MFILGELFTPLQEQFSATKQGQKIATVVTAFMLSAVAYALKNDIDMSDKINTPLLRYEKVEL